MSSKLRVDITLMDNATMFTGIDTIYRYDLPASGMVEGWAIKAVVAQVRDMAAENWPDIDVAVKGTEEAVHAVTHAFLAAGAMAFPIETIPGALGKDRRVSRRYLGLGLGLGSVFVIAAGVIALWGFPTQRGQMINQASHSSAVPASATPRIIYNGEKGSARSDISRYEQEIASSSTQEAGEERKSTTAETLDLGGFILPGLADWEMVGDGVIGTVRGDSSHRILILRDMVYEDAVMAELITEDISLRRVSARHSRPETIDYTEDPGDGSFVYWASWKENPTRISVGCHTRSTATTQQMRICQQVIEKLQLSRKVPAQDR